MLTLRAKLDFMDMLVLKAVAKMQESDKPFLVIEPVAVASDLRVTYSSLEAAVKRHNKAAAVTDAPEIMATLTPTGTNASHSTSLYALKIVLIADVEAEIDDAMESALLLDSEEDVVSALLSDNKISELTEKFMEWFYTVDAATPSQIAALSGKLGGIELELPSGTTSEGKLELLKSCYVEAATHYSLMNLGGSLDDVTLVLGTNPSGLSSFVQFVEVAEYDPEQAKVSGLVVLNKG